MERDKNEAASTTVSSPEPTTLISLQVLNLSSRIRIPGLFMLVGTVTVVLLAVSNTLIQHPPVISRVTVVLAATLTFTGLSISYCHFTCLSRSAVFLIG